MGNLVPVGKSGAIMTYEGSDNPWAEMGQEVESGAFLNFNGNTGEITFGSDDNVVPDGSTVVADLVNMSRGWICWKNGEPVEEVLLPVTQGKPPLEHELKDHGPYDDEDDGWREACAIPMILESVDGDQNDELVGTKLLFKTSTAGAIRSTKKLAGAFGKQFREHIGELPVVELTTESYTPRDKKYGKKYAINFKIVDWLGEDGLAELIGTLNDEGGEYLPEDDAPAAEPEPQPEPEPEPEPEVVEEPAPPPMRRTSRTSAAAPATAAAQAAPEQAPARRRTASAATAAAEPEMEAAPEPRGRSEERGGRRTRRFAR